MTADFMSTHRMFSGVWFGSVIAYDSSSWAKDTIDLAIKHDLLNYAFYNSHKSQP
jgi:hypothetical protein